MHKYIRWIIAGILAFCFVCAVFIFATYIHPLYTIILFSFIVASWGNNSYILMKRRDANHKTRDIRQGKQ